MEAARESRLLLSLPPADSVLSPGVTCSLLVDTLKLRVLGEPGGSHLYAYVMGNKRTQTTTGEVFTAESGFTVFWENNALRAPGPPQLIILVVPTGV